MIAKFPYHSEIFTIIAKITVHSENCLLLFLCLNDSVLVFLLSTLTVILLFHIFFVISLFLSIYKPQSVTNGHQSLRNKFLEKLSALPFSLLHFLSLSFLFSWLPNTLQG